MNLVPGDGKERPGWQIKAIEELNKVIATAVDYPTALIQRIPDDSTDLELTKHIEELAEVAVELNELGRNSIIDKLTTLKKGIPRGPARKTFSAALKKLEVEKQATDRKDREDKTKKAGRELSKMKGHVFQKDGLIFRDTGEVERVSNFMLIPLKRIVKEGSEDWFRCRVEVPYSDLDMGLPGVPTSQVFREAWNISPAAFASSRAFKGILPMECSSNLTDEDLQGLKECFLRDYDYIRLPRIQSTEVLGRHKTENGERFVMPWGTLDDKGVLMSDPDFIYLSTADAPVIQRIAKEITALDSTEIRSTCKTFLERCLSFNYRPTMLTIGGMFFSSLFASRLRRACGGVPLLNLFGSPSSGKTSLVEVFWRFVFGIEGEGLLNVKPTPFAMTRELASTNCVIQCFDEWKADITEDKMKSISELFRGVYSGETLTRGRQDQTVRNYHICAPCCIAGESKIEHDEALMQRCIFASIDRNWLLTHPESVKAFRECQKLRLPSCSPLILSWSMQAPFEALLDQARVRVTEILSKLEHLNVIARMQGNLTYLAFGVLLLSEFAKSVGADVGEVDLAPVIYQTVAESFDIDPHKLVLGASSLPTNFEKFLEDGSTMAATGYAKEDTHFRWIDGRLCLCIKHLEMARQQWYRSRGTVLQSPGVNALRRMARENMEGGGFVTDHCKKVKFGSYSARCVELDVARIPEWIEISKFQTGFQIAPNELAARFGKMSPGGDA